MKSHVTTVEEWIFNRMASDMYVYNELADEAARIGSNKGSSTNTLKNDAMAKHKVRRIALRLAAIEASTWTDDNDFNKFQGKDFKDLQGQRTKKLQVKAYAALDNTDGGDGHSLYVDGKWHRCRDCPGLAHIRNYEYWAKKKCTRHTIETAADSNTVWKEGIKRYSRDPDAAEFQPTSENVAEPPKPVTT